MKRINLGILYLVAISISLSGQNTFNDEGLRTGPWRGFYPDSTLKYEATFENGKPVGLMKRYDVNGNLNAAMSFYSGSDRCQVRMYSKNGKVNATGVYQAQKKDSTWKYLSSDESIRMIENYKLGDLSGITETFYPSGNLSRRISYESGKKNGNWYQFFDTKDTMMKAHYKDDLLHGEYKCFYPDGKIQIDGGYQFDMKEGNWIYYSEAGDTTMVLNYDQGRLLNPEVLEKGYEDFIEYFEENMDEMPDPAIGGEL